MRDLDAVLRESFDAHAGELGRVGEARGALLARSVKDVRRKRMWRAGAAGAVATAAVVSVVATAVATSGGGGDASSATQWVKDDPTSLGPCASFIPANGSLFPDGIYLGRAYIDMDSGFVVAVMPDGTVTRVQPGSDGEYRFDFGDGPTPLAWEGMGPLVMDMMGNGGGGGDYWVDSDPTGWQWTAEPVEPAPAGVNTSSLYWTMAMSFGFGGQGYDPGAVPAGARAEAVAFYADGREVVGAFFRDEPAPSPDEIDVNGLEGMALRVTLADGTVWEARYTYDPSNVPDLPCQPTPPSGVVPELAPTPSTAPASEGPPEPAPGVSAAPTDQREGDWNVPLSGPESAVFACAASLPAELENTADVRARLASGEIALNEVDLFDVGDEGVVIEGNRPVWSVPADALDAYSNAPGWSSSSEGSLDSLTGSVRFFEVVAARDGVVVAAAHHPVTDWTAGGVGGFATDSSGIDAAAQTEGFVNAYNGIRGSLEPCTGAEGALDGATLAVVYGFGPDMDHMEWGWTWADEG